MTIRSDLSSEEDRWRKIKFAGVCWESRRLPFAARFPGMQKGEWSEVAAIASRDKRRAEEAAAKLGIAKAYGSYEELLADPEIDAIYNPLPNHLHVPWSIKAAEAGKHVLCEKPISTTVADARKLLGRAIAPE